MVNKKIFGMPIAMLVIGLLVVGGVSAALVGFLSNAVTATADVGSPLELKIAPMVGGSWGDSLELGNVVGGAEVEFRIRERSFSNTAISSTLVIDVKEAGQVNVCDEMTIQFREQGNNGYTTLPCIVENNNLKFQLGTVVPEGQDAVYEVLVTLHQGAYGSYDVSVRHWD